MKLYQKIARHIEHGLALENAKDFKPLGEEIFDKTKTDIKKVLPSGSGFDSGITVNYDESAINKIVLNADFHHMDTAGYYCGWSEHRIIVTPSLSWGFNLRVTGKNKRGIKEYIYDTATTFLNEEI